MDTKAIQLKIRQVADEAHAAGYREIAGKLHDIARELAAVERINRLEPPGHTMLIEAGIDYHVND